MQNVVFIGGQMNRQQAALEAAKMRSEGKTLDQIGEVLARQGIVSMQTGKPLTGGGVCNLIARAGQGYRRAKKKVKKPSAAPTFAGPASASKRIEAVRSILAINAMDPIERISLAQLILG